MGRDPMQNFLAVPQKLHTGNTVKEWWEIQDRQQQRGACVMDVQDEYVDGSSLEETMQN